MKTMSKNVLNIFHNSCKIKSLQYKLQHNFLNHFPIRSYSIELPELSKHIYNVKRKDFSVLKPSHVENFQSILSKENVITDASELLSYNVDWIKNCRGESSVVLKPNSTKEVSSILKYCNENNLAVCPQGGNTGLVGGSVPVFDEVIINMGRMNKILECNEISGTLVCEAGCILENLNDYLREKKLMMPLDLGAKGSCQIGGNVSTNAGGLRLLRYGSLHESVLGVEVVKADGSIINSLGTFKKDNTGYHIRHLFIGSEGTLGIVTKVIIQCAILPMSVNVAFLGVNKFEDILKIYSLAKSSLGEIISAFEMVDSASLEISMKHLKLGNPIKRHAFYVLIETNGSDETHDTEKISNFLEKVMTLGLVTDGTFCSEPSRIKTLWSLREGVPEALTRGRYVLKYDFSLPLKNYYNIVVDLQERLTNEDNVIVCGYGHIGDSNIHLNVSMKSYCPKIIKKIEPYVYEYVLHVNGSISAEHGIGFKKPNYLHYSKDSSCINLMKDLKKLMDPKGILNPYKVLP